MKRFTCIAAGVLAAALTVAYPWHQADAQIDIGGYVIYADGLTNVGRVYVVAPGGADREYWRLLAPAPVSQHEAVGFIDVPQRDSDAGSYAEIWVLAPEYLASPDLTLEIVPVQDASRASEARGKASRWRGAHRFDVQAQEHDIEMSAEAGEIVAYHGEAGTDVVAYMKEVWQCAPVENQCESDSFELVGLLYASSSHAGSSPRQTWLLSDRYVYPSPRNGIRTQLRPVPHAGAPTVAALVAEASGWMSIRRSIRVELVDSGEFEPADDRERAARAACSYGTVTTDAPYLVLLGVLASSAVGRRRNRRRARK